MIGQFITGRQGFVVCKNPKGKFESMGVSTGDKTHLEQAGFSRSSKLISASNLLITMRKKTTSEEIVFEQGHQTGF